MPARLRGFRLLALILLIGSPGLGGSLVQALHPCAAEMPWLAADGAAHGPHDHGETGSGSQASAECHCIGACAAGAPIVSPAVAPAVRVALGAASAPAPTRPVAVPAAVPSDRLPPATAPPTLA